jgi:2-iminobutanoate/2-iminopropanoate deaminase
MNDFGAVNELYAKCFTSKFPARSTVQVAGLPKGVNVEIEVIARRG